MKIKTVNITDQVVEYLKENIESGKWNIGEKIPSENQMVIQDHIGRLYGYLQSTGIQKDSGAGGMRTRNGKLR